MPGAGKANFDSFEAQKFKLSVELRLRRIRSRTRISGANERPTDEKGRHGKGMEKVKWREVSLILFDVSTV